MATPRKPVTGAAFLRRVRDEYVLDPLDDLLAEACARTVDRVQVTRSAEIARREDRLLGELVSRMRLRQEAAEQPERAERSQRARQMALQRWHGSAG